MIKPGDLARLYMRDTSTKNHGRTECFILSVDYDNNNCHLLFFGFERIYCVEIETLFDEIRKL